MQEWTAFRLEAVAFYRIVWPMPRGRYWQMKWRCPCAGVRFDRAVSVKVTGNHIGTLPVF